MRYCSGRRRYCSLLRCASGSPYHDRPGNLQNRGACGGTSDREDRVEALHETRKNTDSTQARGASINAPGTLGFIPTRPVRNYAYPVQCKKMKQDLLKEL